MTPSDTSRRDVLKAGFGAGAALVFGGVASPATAAPGPGWPSRLRPVSMAMHMHSCFSEGGSYAAGGGGASMMSQLEEATRLGLDVLWYSDHDWRMQAYGYYDGIAFDGTTEDGNLAWFVHNEGPVTATSHEFVEEPRSPAEPGKALRVTATGTEPGWGVSYLWAKAGNSFYSTNISDHTLAIDVLAESVGPDAEAVVQIETSYRPATAGRPGGVYVLEYRVGAVPGRALDGPLTGVVTVAPQEGWQTLTMHPLSDIAAFWPDLVAADSGLARLRFGVRARNSARGSSVFDHLRISRTRDRLEWPVRTQRDLMRELGQRYPHVTQVLSSEVSMVRHINVYMEDFELYPYPPRGKAPVLDNSVEGTREVVEWYQARGALVQYNHPPNNPEELVATRAMGTDLIELASAGGSPDANAQRLALYDVAARNAIFLTATSNLDDHAGREWTRFRNLYFTAVWAETAGVRDLLAGLRGGRVWCYHRPRWPDATIKMTVFGQQAMGGVLLTSRARVPVEITVGGLPENARAEVVVGVCDRTGATAPAVRRVTPDGNPSRGVEVEIERGDGAYARVECYDGDGLLLGYGNPVWILPSNADVAVPPGRELRDPARIRR